MGLYFQSWWKIQFYYSNKVQRCTLHVSEEHVIFVTTRTCFFFLLAVPINKTVPVNGEVLPVPGFLCRAPYFVLMFTVPQLVILNTTVVPGITV